MVSVDQQNIINILGIADLPEERKLAIVEQATELVQKRLLVRIFDGLPGSDKETFKKLVENDDQEALTNFFSEKVPAFEKMLEEEVNLIKQELGGIVDAVE